MEVKRKVPAPDYNLLALEEMYGRHNGRKVLVATAASLILLVLIVLTLVAH